MFAWFRGSRSPQLKAIFNWLSGIVEEKDVILIGLSGRWQFFYFDFPLCYGDYPKKITRKIKDRETTFIIRSTSQEPLDDQWVNIFGSPEIEMFENRNRISGTPPLRWGLSEEEKILALKIARDSLVKFLSDGKYLEREYLFSLPPRFNLKTDFDVALWVKGRLRGSAVIENYQLGEGIAQAALLAAHDQRFKPLDAGELPDARIEITLISNLRLPLTKAELKRNAIYPEKGYLLEAGNRKGWYLPEVFNVIRFRNLEEFLGNLAAEKARLPRPAYKKANIYIFEVDDFIELENREKPLSLWGPTAPISKDVIANSQEFVIDRCRLAADWLCQIQESDGNIPPIIDPLTGRIVRQSDWPRLAFTAWALAEFGKATSEKKYVQTAEKSFEYLKKFLILNSQFPVPSYELTLAYFGQLALALGHHQDAYFARTKINERLTALQFEPITLAQIASFFKVILWNDRRFLEPFEKITGTLKEKFENALAAKVVMNLAVWAELANTLWDVDSEFSRKVAEWLKSQQLLNGAFPESTVSDFVYTRGTGKIFEVLALDFKNNRAEITVALTWLLAMQYNRENTFFVPKEIRQRILGAFRHDYFNTEAWIDAVGHILLGATRY